MTVHRSFKVYGEVGFLRERDFSEDFDDVVADFVDFGFPAPLLADFGIAENGLDEVLFIAEEGIWSFGVPLGEDELQTGGDELFAGHGVLAGWSFVGLLRITPQPTFRLFVGRLRSVVLVLR